VRASSHAVDEAKGKVVSPAMINDNRKIGMGLTAFGTFFLLLGTILLFDRALLALGNMLFLCGITLLIGAQKTAKFFFRRSKLRGTTCFLGGIIVVLAGWSMVGMIVEVFGIINLFGNFFPVILTFMREVPVIGTILNLPPLARFCDQFVGSVLPTHVSRSE